MDEQHRLRRLRQEESFVNVDNYHAPTVDDFEDPRLTHGERRRLVRELRLAATMAATTSPSQRQQLTAAEFGARSGGQQRTLRSAASLPMMDPTRQTSVSPVMQRAQLNRRRFSSQLDDYDVAVSPFQLAEAALAPSAVPSKEVHHYHHHLYYGAGANGTPANGGEDSLHGLDAVHYSTTKERTPGLSRSSSPFSISSNVSGVQDPIEISILPTSPSLRPHAAAKKTPPGSPASVSGFGSTMQIKSRRSKPKGTRRMSAPPTIPDVVLRAQKLLDEARRAEAAKREQELWEKEQLEMMQGQRSRRRAKSRNASAVMGQVESDNAQQEEAASVAKEHVEEEELSSDSGESSDENRAPSRTPEAGFVLLAETMHHGAFDELEEAELSSSDGEAEEGAPSPDEPVQQQEQDNSQNRDTVSITGEDPEDFSESPKAGKQNDEAPELRHGTPQESAPLMTVSEDSPLSSQDQDASYNTYENAVMIPSAGLENENDKAKSHVVPQKSSLPRFASEQVTNPTRPPPQVHDHRPQVNLGTRQVRSASDGNHVSRQPIEKTGWMMKMPHKNWFFGQSANWKRRYFKLSGTHLVYMVSEDAKTEKNRLDLSKVIIKTDPATVGRCPTRFSMLLYEPGKMEHGFRVCTNSFKEIKEWYDAIVNNHVFVCGNTNPSSPPVDRSPKTKAEKLALAEKKRKAKIPKRDPPKSEEFYPLFKRPATHYDLLGISSNATTREIRKAFYKLAASYHPDKNPDADPHEFAALSSAYEVLHDEQLREKYNLGEKIKEVLRIGFDCTIYVPSGYTIKNKKKVPTKLTPEKVTLFADGNMNCIYWQKATDQEFEPLQPNVEKSFELRFVQRVLFGHDHPVTAEHLYPEELSTEERYEMDTIAVMKGTKLEHDMFLRLDSVESCREMVNGLRVIRSEGSVLFAQVLEKQFAEGRK